ncbi:MAG: SDR family NAD(P)-dependent oxidoreductase [Candidatus Hodarchaeota archaeon]
MKHILITGSDTGIGKYLTLELANNKEHIYAGVLHDGSTESFSEFENITPVKLDVTKTTQISSALDIIKEKGTGLDVLINNAGIIVGGPMVDIPEEMLMECLDVNVLGVYRVTKAFFPLLLESKGRIINMSSMAGLFSPPFLGAYCMTKHALEAYSDSIRRELGPLGMKVSIIEPDDIKTPIFERASEGVENLKKWVSNTFKERAINYLGYKAWKGPRMGMEIQSIRKPVFDAIYSENPRMRYVIVPSRIEFMIAKAMNDKMLDRMSLKKEEKYKKKMEERGATTKRPSN